MKTEALLPLAALPVTSARSAPTLPSAGSEEPGPLLDETIVGPVRHRLPDVPPVNRV
jgi:hypothetical protein